MLALTLATLIAVISIATALTLIDSALRMQSLHTSLKRQRALAKAGFVPQVEAREVRLRGPVRRHNAGTGRPLGTRVPRPTPPARALGAA